MDANIIAAIINAVTTLLVSGVIFLVINKYLNQQQSKLNLEVERAQPSHKSIFEDNRAFLQILYEAKEKFFEIYIDKPKSSFVALDKRIELFENPLFAKKDILHINKTEYSLFKSFLEEEHTKYVAMYRAIIASNAYSFEEETLSKINNLYAKIPLIHPDIKRAGEEILKISSNFRESDELTCFLKLIGDDDKTETEIIKLIYEFGLITKKDLDGKYTSIEGLFLKFYGVVAK